MTITTDVAVLDLGEAAMLVGILANLGT